MYHIVKNGKDFNDTLKVAAKWDAWADENYSVPYEGYVMTPFYQRKSDFPYVKLKQYLESAQDEWAAKGTKLAEDFER